MSSSVPSKPTSKPAVTLSLNDILSDIDAFPSAQDSIVETSNNLSGGSSTTTTLLHPDDRVPLPEKSESVEASIEISQRFINNSKQVLKNTDELDAVKERLDHVDYLLGEVEQSIRS